MSDLKNLYDRVLIAQAETEKVKNQIAEALAVGTKEGEERALALESQLDETVAEETRWHALYDKMVKSKSDQTLQNFVPISDTPADAEAQPASPKVLKLREYQNLAPRERLAFAKSGGKLEEEE